MTRILAALGLVALATGCASTPPLTPAKISQTPAGTSIPTAAQYGEPLVSYVQMVEKLPLVYTMTAETRMPGLRQRTYDLTSQAWTDAQPAPWRHDVVVLEPDHAMHGRALMIVNNGQRPGKGDAPAGPSADFTMEALAALAMKTQTAVISISDVPNQPLTYPGDVKARREDDLVAHGWSLFMQAPAPSMSLPVHVPMAAAVSRAMTLAQRELGPLDIRKFVVSGVSKRAWAAWLTTIADPRIDAIVPFALDLLDTPASLKNIYDSYGGNWPLAFGPYYAEGIDKHIATPRFEALMRIEDPLAYLDSAHAARLSVPKYVVNASGDDFFVPDNSSLYFGKLPGPKALRMVPNASHYSIKASLVDTLGSFVKRIQQGSPLPELTATQQRHGGDFHIEWRASETPRELRLWAADNPEARDFRHACGIRYSATTIAPGATRVAIKQPETGWRAYFVEATLDDGFVATTPVYIMGTTAYPTSAPPQRPPHCRTLPGRG